MGLADQERRRFAFLLDRLAQLDTEQLDLRQAPPHAELILGALPASVLSRVATVLLDELVAFGQPSLEAHGRRLVEWLYDSDAGLRNVSDAIRLLKRAGAGAFILALLAEAKAAIEMQRGNAEWLRRQVMAYMKRARRRGGGRPSRPDGERRLKALRHLGLTRDQARDLLHAVRLAAPMPWPALQHESSPKYRQPTLLQLLQAAVDDGRLDGLLTPRVAGK